MSRVLPTFCTLAAAALATATAVAQMTTPAGPLPKALPPDTIRPERFAGGYVLERDGAVAREEPGTHGGGGRTIGYSFFKDTPNLGLVFRKRALTPGSAIGYHEQKEDEIYYVISGRGVMTIDGKQMEVGPGTAVLTRPGSSHGLEQRGTEDLVILINYLNTSGR